jgi:threonine/homoserine/homoserine lactone efflux protein
MFGSNALLTMALYGSLLLMMPGPTNTLLLSSGLQVGVRKTLPLVAGEALGYVTAISLWGFFLLTFVAADAPWILHAVKLLCSAYILWLAVRMWMQTRLIDENSGGPVSMKEIFLVTVMNPKALLFASTLFPLEAFQSAEFFFYTVAVFLMFLGPIAIAWSCLGWILKSRRSLTNHTSAFLRIASVFLALFSGSLAISVFRQ